MVYALLLGREGSVGFPGKNMRNVLGKPLMEYPLLAALKSKLVDDVYVSTDDVKIKEVALKNGANVIDRPDYLCTKEALGEDAFVHGYKHIKEKLKKEIEFMVLLFCNAPCVLPEQIDEAIHILRVNPDYDSVITISKYNMYAPVRARKIGSDGLMQPFIPFEQYLDGLTVNCDRDAQGDVYFADCCLSVVRPHCLDNMHEYGMLPQKWMGRKIYPLKQWGGLDVDYEWQIPQIEYWLKYHNVGGGGRMF